MGFTPNPAECIPRMYAQGDVLRLRAGIAQLSYPSRPPIAASRRSKNVAVNETELTELRPFRTHGVSRWIGGSEGVAGPNSR